MLRESALPLLLASVALMLPVVTAVDPDALLNVTQIITRWGYPAENYEVITPDGYILQIQRIPHGIKNTTVGSKVLFIQHGLCSSAFDFVCNPPSESLGFFAADQGYDVWLGNVRGNTYSRRHVNMSTDSKEFWKFTYDEFIEYDMPTMIDFVLEKTGKDSLYYAGHSQGTLVMFGLLSTRMEYQKKIKAFAAMGPVANLTTITSPIRYLAPFTHDIDFITEWLGSGEFLASSKFFKAMAKTLCAFAVSRELCEDVMFVLQGLDSTQMNITRLSVYISHDPAGTSVRNMNHFAQGVESERFQKYDFGVAENKRRYGQPAPPEYDVKNIYETPIGLYWSANDWLADPKDVAILIKTLPSLAVNFEIVDRKFTHTDFLFGMTARKYAYEPVLEFLSKY